MAKVVKLNQDPISNFFTRNPATIETMAIIAQAYLEAAGVQPKKIDLPKDADQLAMLMQECAFQLFFNPKK